MGDDIWMAHWYIKTSPSNGSRTCIPTLKGKDRNGENVTTTTNEEKGNLLARMLFPPPPDTSSVPADFTHPDPVDKWSPITREHLNKAIRNLTPYKAPGLDGIANIVFKHCPSLADHLLPLFNAVFMLRTYYEPWRESITVILHKQGKPDYTVPKVYHPIALLNTTAKLLSAIVTDRVSYLLEAHGLLLHTHFGSRPGRSTMDSLHLLETTIKHTWWQGKVASALFLDIEGAFPNAVTDQLIHNMKTWYLPKVIVSFTECLLRGHKMKLKFDNFVSDWVPITNGIGQGDPISMLLYIIYSSDLVDVAKGSNELTRQLYQAVIVPRVTYAASVWLHPLYKQGSDKPQHGSLSVVKRLERIQCMVAITILGALCTSPTDTLELHAYLPPTSILLQEILHQSMVCMAMLPKSHPLRLKIDWIEKHDVWHHRSALHHLIHTLGIRPSELEIITPHPTKPNVLPPMTMLRRPKVNLGQTTTLGDSEREGRIGLN